MPTNNNPIDSMSQEPAVNVPPAVPPTTHAAKYLYIAIAAAALAIGGGYYMFFVQGDAGATPQASNSTSSEQTEQGIFGAQADTQLEAAMPSDSNADFQSVDADINQL